MEKALVVGVVMLLSLLLWAVAAAISTAIIFFGWNLVVSPVAHLSTISFTQAFLIGALLSLIRGTLSRIPSN